MFYTLVSRRFYLSEFADVSHLQMRHYLNSSPLVYFASCLCLVSLFVLGFQRNVFAAEQWVIDGLPDELSGSLKISKDVGVYDAANTLVHILENEGYPLATASINGQAIVANLGRVEQVEAIGFDQKTTELAESYLRHLLGSAPMIETIDHVTGLIHDIPGISAGIQFNRLSEDGAYEAVLIGSQLDQSGSVSVYNTPTKGTSGREAAFHQEFYSLARGGDIFRIEVAASDQESQSLSMFGEVSYQTPVTDNGTFAELRLSHFDSGSDFDFRSQNDGDTKSSAAAVLVGHQFERMVSAARTGYIELDYRVDDDDQTAKRENGVARLSWFHKQETDFGDTFSYGLTASAGRSFTGTEETFGSLRGGVGFITWLPAVSETTEVLVEASGQLGSKDQPSFELFSFGGQNKQRGFTPFEYAGSSGLNITVEAGRTYHPDVSDIMGVTPYVFVDASYMANPSTEMSTGRPEDVSIASTGLGARLSFSGGFSINSWLASPIHDSEISDRSHGPVLYVQGQYSW